jgi:membrane protein YdbS with pleckstrin-like domain
MLINCRVMRFAVILSGLMLAAGVLLGTATMVLGLSVAMSQLALVSVLGAALLLAVTFLVALIPGVSRQMDECRH